MRLLALAAASTLALGAASCAPHPNYAARTALDCPDHQGELDRTGVSPDGKSCTYRGDGGTEITLQLTPVNGDATTTLDAIEASLVGPAAAPGAKPAEAPAPAAAKPEKPETAEKTDKPVPAAGPGDAAAQAARQASQDTAGGGKTADWDTGDHGSVTVNGKAVVVGDGDHAHINLPGLHIDADDNNARVNIGGIHIDANDNEATIHVVRDVRLRGEAFSREKRGLRATFIAKRDNLPDGYHFVGYEASGPKTGPLTVAIVKSRDEINDGDRLYRDIRRLVRRNGGA
jgi:hypothetical protein